MVNTLTGALTTLIILLLPDWLGLLVFTLGSLSLLVSKKWEDFKYGNYRPPFSRLTAEA